MVILVYVMRTHLLSDHMVSEIHQMCGLDTVSVSMDVRHVGRSPES